MEVQKPWRAKHGPIAAPQCVKQGSAGIQIGNHHLRVRRNFFRFEWPSECSFSESVHQLFSVSFWVFRGQLCWFFLLCLCKFEFAKQRPSQQPVSAVSIDRLHLQRLDSDAGHVLRTAFARSDLTARESCLLQSSIAGPNFQHVAFRQPAFESPFLRLVRGFERADPAH